MVIFSSTPGSSSLSGRKRKRGSKWDDAHSKDELAIAKAMASFSDSSSQELTEAQKLQLKEQMEVRRALGRARTISSNSGRSKLLLKTAEESS